MQTPYFLISQQRLDENIAAFKTALRLLAGSCLSYSVKTNSLPWILRYLKLEVLAEVVSDEEYELALLCGYKDEELSSTVPSRDRTFRASKRKAFINLTPSMM